MAKIKIVDGNAQTKWITINDTEANKIIMLLKIKASDFVYG